MSTVYDNTNSQAQEKRKLKSSKAFYLAVIIGFIGLFWLIILPFLPMTMDGSFFESGFKYFSNYKPGNLIVTISMIPHTIFLLVAGIVLLSRFKTHKAAVVYSFYRLYVVTMYLAFFTWFGFTIFGFEDVLYQSYGVEYWYYVLITYLVGIIFILIGQWANGATHACKYKTGYNVLTWLAAIGLYFLSLKFKDGVYVRQIFNSMRNAYESTYTLVGYLLFFLLVKKTFTVIMPVNSCFSFMYKKDLKRGAESNLPIGGNVFGIVLSALLFCYFLFCGAYAELIFAGLLLLYFVFQIVAAKKYNKRQAGADENVSVYDFYGRNNTKSETNANVEKSSNVGANGVTPTSKPESEIVWKVDRLKSYNNAITATEKVPLNDICLDLYNQIQSNGISIEMTELREILSALASSKLVFIRCSEKTLIKRFAKILSEYFSSEFFFEERLPKDNTSQDVRSIPAPEITPIPEVAPETENVTEESEKVTVKETDDELNFKESEVSESVDKDSVDIVVQTESKNQPTEEEIMRMNKYGVISGIYVSYHLSDVLCPVFIDNTSAREVDDFDADILSAVSNRDETVFVGKKNYLASADNYDKGSMIISENLRMVVFVAHGDTEISAHHEWVKYSTVLNLTLNENFDVVEDETDKKNITNTVFSQAVEEAQDDNYITEDYWKKIDRLEEYLKEKADITFDNRFLRQVEKYAATFLACGATKTQTVDAVLANRIIPYIATEKESVLGALESDFSLHLDELFGYENIPLTKVAIKEYGLQI